MTPEKFSEFEDDKAIRELKSQIAEIVDGKDMYIVFSALHEMYFTCLPHVLKDPKKYLIRLAADCLKKSKTIKPIKKEEL
jgi:hypothetical protein